MSKKWANVPGSTTIQFGDDEDARLPACLMVYCDPNGGESVRLEWTSTGYYDYGCRYLPNGDPGYPPEGDDERIVAEAYLIRDNGAEVRLPTSIRDQLAEMFHEQIDAEELEPPERDYD